MENNKKTATIEPVHYDDNAYMNENVLTMIVKDIITIVVKGISEVFLWICEEIMKPEMKGAFIGAAATVLVGAPGLWFTYQSLQIEKSNYEAQIQEKDKTIATYKQQGEVAPKLFVSELEKLIAQADAERKGKQQPSEMIAAAKALVSARNSFRSDLETVRDRLDSEIDQLELELAKKKPNKEKVSELLSVINRKWPAKKLEIEVAMKRLKFGELGLIPQ